MESGIKAKKHVENVQMLLLIMDFYKTAGFDTHFDTH